MKDAFELSIQNECMGYTLFEQTSRFEVLSEKVSAVSVECLASQLCLHKTTAGMFETNHGSRRLFESLGFRPEAVLREQAAWHGRRVDILKYGLLSREWNQSEGKEVGSC